mgnify:FL=1
MNVFFGVDSISAPPTVTNNTHTMLEDKNRGQVGIGTLIVFIAMVLVAAMAAGVLINTAGMLQAQAESTGEESTAQVSNNIQIQTAYGNVTGDGKIDEVNLTISLQPGSDRINFTASTIEWLGDDLTTLDPSPGGDLTYKSIQGTDEESLESGDHINVLVNINGTDSNPEPLTPGDTAEITIITEDGSYVRDIFNVPSTMSAKDGSIRL